MAIALWEKRKKMKILLLGDSITQGIGKKSINYQMVMENKPELFMSI